MIEEQIICDKVKQEPGVDMYKVVIVDDEPIIAEGLSKVVPWEKYGCKIAATAGNGQEGLEVIRKEQPNIVISDISMPGMDGLKMIAALRVEFPEMQISILTGYRDFDYAQQAIRLGVTRFLLKPSNMDEIEEAVQVMAENLKKCNITGEEDESENTAGSFIVKNALAYIQENYNKKISLSEVAENTFVSQWHLSKLLNKHLEKSFSEILNSIRIDKAKELLKDPSLRIGDVAEEVGFLDMAHFSRVFKKIEGISANEYRNKI